jgi:hypothetical protein
MSPVARAVDVAVVGARLVVPNVLPNVVVVGNANVVVAGGTVAVVASVRISSVLVVGPAAALGAGFPPPPRAEAAATIAVETSAIRRNARSTSAGDSRHQISLRRSAGRP